MPVYILIRLSLLGSRYTCPYFKYLFICAFLLLCSSLFFLFCMFPCPIYLFVSICTFHAAVEAVAVTEGHSEQNSSPKNIDVTNVFRSTHEASTTFTHI